MKNVYIHIPFCASNCSYCTFTKIISQDANIYKQYFESLKREMLTSPYLQKGDIIKTLYFGGGTPSIISENILEDFFSFLHKYWKYSENVEITFEVHPVTVNPSKLQCWKDVGINRISFGVQTFQKKYDTFLERNLQKTQNSLDMIKQFSFHLSVDCIFGFPQQEVSDLQKDLDLLMAYEIDHMSYYALDYKVHSKIEQQWDERLEFEKYCELYNYLTSFLESRGYDHYEIFNFSKNNHYSKHNLNFWNQEDYMGFGLSAVSGIGNIIQENTKNLKEYMQGKWIADSYELSEEECLELYLKKALRLKEGINISNLQSQFPQYANKVLENTQTLPSWINISHTSLSLTQEGKMNFSEGIEYIIN